MNTCASLFSGGGLAEVGLKRAGLTPLWAVEYDPDIAAVYARNHGDHVLVADVCSVDCVSLPRPDLLWASPPCPNFSVAKTGRGETPQDLAMADAVVRALETLRPAAFVLENVRGYAESQSYRLIRAALDRLDYWSDAEVINAADMGTPQTRERLVLRAKAGGVLQPFCPWPAPVRWRGWYEAIEDLIPTLPDSQFAPWQLARLPEKIRDHFLVGGANTSKTQAAPGVGISQRKEPARALTASMTALPRAFIVDGQGDGKALRIAVRHGDAPMLTITAQAGMRQAMRAWLVEGRVVALTPRCLARFQGLSDSYWLPEKKSLACRVVGNGVAVEVAYKAARSLQ